MNCYSLAYRKNRDAILNGQVPDKYTRLLPYVHGQRVMEIGAAEGVLSLLIATKGAEVVAIERNEERFQEALRLKARWQNLGRKNLQNCNMFCGDILEHMHLMRWVETLVAVRAIYYLKDAIYPFFGAVREAKVDRIVLCGNANRAKRPDEDFNFYASIPGMTKILESNQYRIDAVVKDGDPIVVGLYR